MVLNRFSDITGTQIICVPIFIYKLEQLAVIIMSELKNTILNT